MSFKPYCNINLLKFEFNHFYSFKFKLSTARVTRLRMPASAAILRLAVSPVNKYEGTKVECPNY